MMMNNICMMMINVTIAVIVLMSILPGPTCVEAKSKRLVITNNHTNYLSLRCFSFDDDLLAQHLKPNQNYTFAFNTRTLFPSATMFNCSTNMGVFVAYRYDYPCANTDDNVCEWRYDENKTYLWDPLFQRWKGIDYNPNYESLTRGGVVKGYYSNK